ncbi:MAG: GNAT family N-acetyltransferase [Planctomycetota bacterium]|nr:GNAT family N-acetyltransferase [Planctomycetota bacterium]
MSIPVPLLVTERLFIRTWQREDLQPVIDFCSDPVVMKYVGDGHCWSDAECLDFLVQEIRHQRQHGFCRWAVVDQQEGLVIGFCGFVSRGQSVEMGWRLATPAWGRGLASEAALAVLHYASETLHLALILATIQPGNRASLRLAKKIGFQETSQCARKGRQLVVFEASGRPQP